MYRSASQTASIFSLGGTWQRLETFFIITVEEEVLGISSRQSPGMLLNNLRRRGWSRNKELSSPKYLGARLRQLA